MREPSSSVTPEDARPAAGPRDHPLRALLTGEIHARPYPAIAPPMRASHLALVSGEDAAEAERAHIATLCARLGAPPPPADATHFAHDFGAFSLLWERHTEFSTYTIMVRGPFADPFGDDGRAADAPPVARVPADWLAALPGERLVATHVAFYGRETPPPDDERLARLFRGNPVAGGGMLGGGARGWSDFRLHDDGFGRVLLYDLRLKKDQAGRLLQRVLEIETYRMMALLALPMARRDGPLVSEIDRALTGAMDRMREATDAEDESRLLDELTRLSARLEAIQAANSYRFGAARAYYGLVARRLEELREVRIEGSQPWRPFLERRLAPAIRTCESLARRQEALSQRLARATGLLRTRINVTLERQNRDLLASMNRRARLQIRLQETVEGLSVVAISYYAVGLIGYAAKALAKGGLPIDPGLAQGIAIAPVALAVWLGIRRLRTVVARRESDGR